MLTGRFVLWRVAAMSLFAFCFVAAQATPIEAVPLDRPNVLVIVVDDLGSWTGCLGGHPQVKTPHIDALAARSTLFTRAYCAAPEDNASRTSLLTGLRPSTTGIYDSSQPLRLSHSDVITIPQFFLEQDYRVLGAGNIFHARFPDPDSWTDSFTLRVDVKPDERPLSGVQVARFFDWGPLDVGADEMRDSKVVDWTIRQLEEEHTQPFFLAVGLQAAALPWYVPREYFDRYASAVTLPEIKDDDLEDLPLGGKSATATKVHQAVVDAKAWQAAVRSYLASISLADAMVGRILKTLEASRYARDTIVVLCGDHGVHLGQKRHWTESVLWEEATRVPLVIYVPGLTTGQRSGRTVSLLDLYPTLIELCGLPRKSRLDGQSIARLVSEPDTVWRRPVVMTNGRYNHAVRSEQWRYVRYANRGEELYDHTNDPHEWTNLARQVQHGVLKRNLAIWLPEKEAPPAPAMPSPHRLDRRRIQERPAER